MRGKPALPTTKKARHFRDAPFYKGRDLTTRIS